MREMIPLAEAVVLMRSAAAWMALQETPLKDKAGNVIVADPKEVSVLMHMFLSPEQGTA